MLRKVTAVEHGDTDLLLLFRATSSNEPPSATTMATVVDGSQMREIASFAFEKRVATSSGL